MMRKSNRARLSSDAALLLCRRIGLLVRHERRGDMAYQSHRGIAWEPQFDIRANVPPRRVIRLLAQPRQQVWLLTAGFRRGQPLMR